MNAPTFSRICAHKRLVVRLEDHPLRAAIQAFLDVKRESADRNVLVVVGQLVGAAQGARAPDDAAEAGKEAEAVDAERIQIPFSASLRLTCKPCMPFSAASSPAGAFHTPRCVSVRAMTPAMIPHGTKVSSWPSQLRIRLDDAREIDRRIAGLNARQAKCAQTCGGLRCSGLLVRAPGGGRIDNEHRASSRAISHRCLINRPAGVSPPRVSAGMHSKLNKIRLGQRIHSGLVVLIADKISLSS